jgi:hypothetical protein
MLNFKKTLISIIVFQLFSPFTAQSQDLFKAKLGIAIKDDNGSRRARAIDRITKGDKLIIYVKSEIDSYIYIVNSNNSGASLLNRKPENQLIISDIGRQYPKQGSAYRPDGKEGLEKFVIIISKDKNKEIIKRFSSGTISNKKWVAIEREIMKTSSLVSPFEPQQDMEFGGSLRGGDTIWDKLRVSAGKSLIAQKFEFDVKK